MDKKTLIVSVGDYAFKQAKKRNFYACPASYGRNEGEYVAFYQNAPESAITHYAKVEEIIEDEGDFLNPLDQMEMMGRSESEKATVFKLGEIKELETKVENDLYGGLQGAWYKEFDDLKNAEKLSDLSENANPIE